MQISYNGEKFLHKEEGFRDKAYLDTAGVWTIGYGTTRVNGKPVEAGQTCTEQEAREYFKADIAWVQTAINKLVKVKLTQNMFDALCSFVYNIGETAFRKSTLLRLLNQGDYLGAANQFKRWKIGGPGLIHRRKREEQLFLSK